MVAVGLSDQVDRTLELLASIPPDANLLEYLKSDFARDLLDQGGELSRTQGDESQSGGLLWAPQGMPIGKLVAPVSSRLGQVPGIDSNLFGALRTIVARLGPDEILLTGSGMALDRYLTRAAKLFDRACTQLRRQSLKSATASWLRSTEGLYLIQSGGNSSMPLDSEIINLADVIYVLNCRPNGTVYKSLDKKMAANLENPVRVWADGDVATRNEWLERGAVDWHVLQDVPDERVGNPVAVAVDPATINFDDYFVHWTRDQKDGFVDESEYDLIDRCLLGVESPGQQFSALGAIRRILSQRKLAAGQRSYRGKCPCGSFSEVPLPELVKKRTYRPHRGRWDYEHYGIAIRKHVLQRLGIRQVIYGDEATWESLPEESRFLFQAAHASSSDIDWSEEREWRSLGNVDLKTVLPEEGFVFVKNHNEIELISSLSRWPVIAIEDLS